MAIYTQLSPIALPGKRHSFLAKTPETPGEKGLGPFTALSILALPGSIHSFAAKTSAIGEKGLGPFTAQSVTATPGLIHSFIAKTPGAGGVKGEGLFTELSAIALPGIRHVFLPKIVTPVSAYSPPPYLSHGHGGWGPETRPRWEREEIRKKVLKDDAEILEIIMGIVLSGRLD